MVSSYLLRICQEAARSPPESVAASQGRRPSRAELGHRRLERNGSRHDKLRDLGYLCS